MYLTFPIFLSCYDVVCSHFEVFLYNQQGYKYSFKWQLQFSHDHVCNHRNLGVKKKTEWQH